jgi:hypothetical protein
MLNLYILSRIVMAFARRKIPLIIGKNNVLRATGLGRRLYAGVCWAVVIYQFHRRYPLQASLAQSMNYLHEDSLQKGERSWKKNLGAGASYIPFVAVVVWFLKIFVPPFVEEIDGPMQGDSPVDGIVGGVAGVVGKMLSGSSGNESGGEAGGIDGGGQLAYARSPTMLAGLGMGIRRLATFGRAKTDGAAIRRRLKPSPIQMKRNESFIENLI